MKKILHGLYLKLFPHYDFIINTQCEEKHPSKMYDKAKIYSIFFEKLSKSDNCKLHMEYDICPSDVLSAAIKSGHIHHYSSDLYTVSANFQEAVWDHRLERRFK
jgi:hypothetical protein